jgi:hypothetical protein
MNRFHWVAYLGTAILDPRPDHGPEMVHDLGNIASELEESSHSPLPQGADWTVWVLLIPSA